MLVVSDPTQPLILFYIRLTLAVFEMVVKTFKKLEVHILSL